MPFLGDGGVLFYQLSGLMVGCGFDPCLHQTKDCLKNKIRIEPIASLLSPHCILELQ